MRSTASKLAIFIVAPLLTSCLESEAVKAACPESECGPIEFRQAFFPMAVGNAWTFAEAASADSAESFTLSVTGWNSGTLHSDGGPQGAWWDLALAPPAGGTRSYEWLSTRYWRQGDSIYARQPGFDDFVPALSYLVPPDADTVRWESTYGGDVGVAISAIRLPDSVTVPAGRFAPCVAFEFMAAEAHRTVICSRVGWVSFDVGSRSIRLVDYTLRR